jgi:ATP-dependent DNA helicase RecG
VDNQRVSVRSWIARELVSNILVHREYSNGFLAKIVVEEERLFAENWNRSSRHGRIDPNNFTPHAKNPLLAWFFVNIGRADWMGSGIRNLYKYTEIYSGGEPELIEGDVFRTIIPLKIDEKNEEDLHGDTMQDTMQVTMQDERIEHLLDFCSEPRTRNEMQQYMDMTNRDHFRITVLKPLLASGKLIMTIPDKPNSRNQRYVRFESSLKRGYYLQEVYV